MIKKSCEFCDGTGQISSFKGVSRFLLSTEECPQCAGLGFLIKEEDPSQDPPDQEKP